MDVEGWKQKFKSYCELWDFYLGQEGRERKEKGVQDRIMGNVKERVEQRRSWRRSMR